MVLNNPKMRHRGGKPPATLPHLNKDVATTVSAGSSTGASLTPTHETLLARTTKTCAPHAEYNTGRLIDLLAKVRRTSQFNPEISACKKAVITFLNGLFEYLSIHNSASRLVLQAEPA